MGWSLLASSSGFMPHGMCYLWQPFVLWLNVVSDGFIVLAYFSIPLVLVAVVRSRADLRYDWLFWSFAAFIFLCGSTHLMAIWNVWHANYVVQGYLKAATAVASVATALAAMHVVPQIRSVPTRVELERSHAELEQLRERLSAAQEIGHFGNWEWDVPSGAVWWSDETYRIFGAETGAPVDYPTFLSRVVEEDRTALERQIEASLRPGAAYELAFRVARRTGEVRALEATGRVEHDARGNAVRVSGVVHDVTERLQLERRLQQTQKLEALGRLAGGVAHDFNNLLTGVSGFLEFARGSLDRDHVASADLDDALALVLRGREVTRHLLSFSRNVPLTPVEVDLNEVLRDTGRLLDRLLGEGVELHLEPNAEVSSIVADPTQIEQVVVNLALNARDAMPDGGTLTIATANHPSEGFGESIMVGSPLADEAIYVCVRDSGTGIPRGGLEHVLEPFFTTKGEGHGTGLGLSIVQGTAVQHGGGVVIHSEAGQGTMVEVVFPAATGAPRPAGGPSPEQTEPVTSRRVLLVEDNASVRSVLARQLAAVGHEVHVAEGVVEALEAFAARDTAVDVLVTDIGLPDGDGISLYSALATENPGLPVVFISGYSERAPHPGLFPDVKPIFLEKPFAMEALAEAVNSAIRGGAGQDQPDRS